MLLADSKEDVLDQLRQHKGYRLVVTGHSLGGGENASTFKPSDVWCEPSHRILLNSRPHLLIAGCVLVFILRRLNYNSSSTLARFARDGALD